MGRPPEWDYPPTGRPVVGRYDPKLGRIRHHTDDFFDHRKELLKHAQHALAESKKRK